MTAMFFRFSNGNVNDLLLHHKLYQSARPFLAFIEWEKGALDEIKD